MSITATRFFNPAGDAAKAGTARASINRIADRLIGC
jgi:hypothetical protein